MDKYRSFDVIIIGGSYAGLSAAMSLGRSLRKTLVIDSGTPCNIQTPHSHNFLTNDGKTPAEISHNAKKQVELYKTVEFYKGLAESGVKINNGFEITAAGGLKFRSRKLIFATGIKDLMPDIKGFSECWGISVIHCPYCHGYEFRNEATGIFANGEPAYELSKLVYNLTKDLTVFTNGSSELTAKQTESFADNNIRIIEAEIAEIKHNAGNISELVFKDGSSQKLKALYAKIPFVQQCDIPSKLGCEMSETGHYKADNLQKTNIEGVFVCGDNYFPLRSVSAAVFSGNMAGAALNKELSEEDF
ncbi:MAG TPA: NAD(P)/FAD-dependent oxidoreductase [Ignavibacteria bacterium]|nr:NAD(P)/FAD-dependent oxidoreductase [Ignavibacteria bacterium]